jgi:hypothetical protein
MSIHALAINYSVRRGLLERHGVNCLATTPIIVTNVHRTEQLERSVCIRNILQPLQGWVEEFTAQLAV